MVMPQAGVHDPQIAAANDASYRNVRRNFAWLVQQAPDLELIDLPACPGWSVRDAVEHVVGIGWKVATRTGMIVGDLPEPGAPAAEFVRAWDDIGPAVDIVIKQRPTMRSQILVMDALTHELDVRVALDVAPPPTRTPRCGVLDLLVSGFGRRVRELGLPGLQIVIDGRKWRVGDTLPTASVTTGWYDLHRSLAGRRTAGQIAALDWSAPADPWLPAFAWGPFHTPLVEIESVVVEAVDEEVVAQAA